MYNYIGYEKPISRVLFRPQKGGDNHLSGTPVARHLKRRYPEGRRAAGNPSLFGLAPCGVYRSRPVTRPLVRSYRTFPPLPAQLMPCGGLSLYGTIPKVTLAGRYPAHCPMELGLSSSAETQTRLSWSLIPTGRLYHIWGRGVKNAPTPCSMRKETIS